MSASDPNPQSEKPSRVGLYLLLGCFFALLLCCGVPAIVIRNVDLDELILGSMSESNAAYHKARESRLTAIATDKALSDEQAVEKLARAVFDDESLAADEIESFQTETDINGRIALRLVLRRDRSSEKVGALEASGHRNTPQMIAARRQATLGFLLSECGLLVKYGKTRNLGSIDVLLQTRAYVDDSQREWFDLFHFRVLPAQFDEFAATAAQVTTPLDFAEDDFESLWSVETDNFDQFTVEVR